jgi:hypothetical protein
VGCPEPERIDRLFFRASDAVLLEALSWTRESAFIDEQGVDLSDHDALSARFAWSSASAD